MLKTAWCHSKSPSRFRPFMTAASVAAALAALAGPATAQAQEVCGDMTCAKGFTCQATPAPCLAIACAEGTPCPPCGDVAYGCVPAACASDADCGTDMVCASYDLTACPAAPPPTTACDPAATVCPPMPPPPVDGTCQTTTVKQCTPRWQLPCQIASDCGAGFTCEEQQSCVCSGGSAASGSTGGDTATSGSGAGTASTTAPEIDGGTTSSCTCTATGERACQPITVSCAADADCLPGWTCKDNPNGSCWSSSTGESGCTPADPAKLCMPPYSETGYVGRDGELAPGAGGTPATPTASDYGEPGWGCAVAGGGPQLTGLFGLALAALIAGVRRRRAG